MTRTLTTAALAFVLAAAAVLATHGGREAPRLARAGASSIPTVTADAFDPAQIGAPAPRPRTLRTLLVTGDSMSTPLNGELRTLLRGHGVAVYTDAHYGGGVSKDFVFDWPRESASAARRWRADATIVFIGANEGFPLREPGGRRVRCCGAAWAAAFANRAREMIGAYRRGGVSRVYWITVPALRDVRRTAIGRVVNAAVAVAAEPWRRQVRLVDAGAIFTPDGYRDSMPVDGVETVVREPDGMHLTAAGAHVLAQAVVAGLAGDFTYPRP